MLDLELAQEERAAPEGCRAGHLQASSPSRSAVRHGLLGARLRRPSTGLARPPPGAFPRSPRAQAECGPAAGSLAAAPPSPRGCGAFARALAGLPGGVVSASVFLIPVPAVGA